MQTRPKGKMRKASRRPLLLACLVSSPAHAALAAEGDAAQSSSSALQPDVSPLVSLFARASSMAEWIPAAFAASSETFVRQTLPIDGTPSALRARIPQLREAYYGIIDHDALARAQAHPISMVDVHVQLDPLHQKEPSTDAALLSASIRTHGHEAAAIVQRSLETALPDRDVAGRLLHLHARQSPVVAVAISTFTPFPPPPPEGSIPLPPNPPFPPLAPGSQARHEDYLESHAGFVVALCTILFVPLLALISCCV